MRRARPEHVDLSDDSALTTGLIARPLEWRVRVVEHVEVDTATSCRRRRSLHVAPLRELLPERAARRSVGAKTAMLVLNVCSVPRGALLDLDVSGPDGAPAFLLPRAEIARREVDYLEGLAAEAGLVVGDSLRQLLEALLMYSSGGWDLGTPKGLRTNAQGFLEDGLGRSVPMSAVRGLLSLDAQVAKLLAPMSRRRSGLSPVEHPLVALPLYSQLTGGSTGDVSQLLESAMSEYLAFIDEALALPMAPAATAGQELLAALIDFGWNYDMLVATTVPLDEPCLIKYSERRALRLAWWSGEAVQGLVISDANSNHLVLEINDPNVRIARVKALQPASSKTTFGAFATRQSDQTYAVYAHGADRDYEMDLHFRLAPLMRLAFVANIISLLLLVLAAAVFLEAPRDLSDLALIVGPSALAASALLGREPSTLGSRLRLRSTALLSLALSALLAAGAWSYVHPRLGSILDRLPGLS